ncbi:MAG: hypothetical protein AAGN82_12025 [Myxococcota bacterium]
MAVLAILAAAGCRDPACTDRLSAVMSKANAAVRDEDPSALRAAAQETTEVVERSELRTMKKLPQVMNEVADKMQKVQSDEDEEKIKTRAAVEYRASIVGMDAAFEGALSFCE